MSKYIQHPSHPFQLIAAALAASGASPRPCPPPLIQPEHLPFCITACGLGHPYSASPASALVQRLKPILLREWDPIWLWMATSGLLPHITSKSDSSPVPRTCSAHALSSPGMCPCGLGWLSSANIPSFEDPASKHTGEASFTSGRSTTLTMLAGFWQGYSWEVSPHLSSPWG